MKKAKLNYLVDLSIGISFLLSAVSGLVFLLPVNVATSFNEILNISYSFWDQLHTWSSLLMIAGVLAHLVLHWKWIVTMTKKTFFPARNARRSTASPAGTGITRRQFLFLGSAATLTGALLVSYWTLTKGNVISAEQGSSDVGNNVLPLTEPESAVPPQPEEEQAIQTQGSVACPRGLVNDPYPGQCRHYTDRNGDGICDYSVPGSGDNSTQN
ncbi:MAG: DUF4405 domain-containing protein [Anaerolineae bacterium]|nr:DUF4405 domain-containing protein [Anaerolineae bacterium]